MELLAQKYLRDPGNTLSSLQAQYGIVSKHGRHRTSLVSLKYDMIDSPMGEQIVRECRGTIVDTSNDYAVVALPFAKFFNEGEGHADVIDWSQARVQEKLDGSLAIVYWYDGEWHVASSGTPDGAGDINGSGMSFADLFWQTAKASGLKLPNGDDPWCEAGKDKYGDYTFMFELCTSENRVIVVHELPRIVLIGCRNRKTGWELDLNVAHELIGKSVERVKEYALTDLSAIRETFSTMNPLQQEGYVVAAQRKSDGTFARVKIKSPAYVAMHHARDGLITDRAFYEIALAGVYTRGHQKVGQDDFSELLATFPGLQSKYDGICASIDALANQIDTVYSEHRYLESQKDFALAVKHHRFSSALFTIRSGRIKDGKSFLKQARPEMVMQWMAG